MKNRVIFTLVLCASLLCLLHSCKKAEFIDNFTTQSLNPALPGEFEVKTEYYTIPGMPEFAQGVVYSPLQNITAGPLVLLLHGNGTGGYKNYSVISKHLASQGFRVASISWPSNAYTTPAMSDMIKSVLNAHIRFLYSNPQSPLVGKITDDMILMGHSRGGAAVLHYANEIEKLKNVQAIISLAPSLSNTDVKEKYTLQSIKSLLIIYGSSDPDVTGGVNEGDNVRRSGFKIFDDAGNEGANSTLIKDMIFMDDLNHITFLDKPTDQFSNTIVNFKRQKLINGYLNAFMQLRINNKENYNQFFKFQKPIPNTATDIKVSQQHTDANKLILANFENEQADKLTHYAGAITYPALTIESKVNIPMAIDVSSLHASSVMAINWQQANNKPAPVIDFAFKNKINLSEYNYLSIRAGMCLNKINNIYAGQSFFIQLHDDNGNKSSLQPITIPANFYNEEIKTYMQSFLLPLNNFKGVDVDKIKSVSINFINPNFPKGYVMIDNIEFYK